MPTCAKNGPSKAKNIVFSSRVITCCPTTHTPRLISTLQDVAEISCQSEVQLMRNLMHIISFPTSSSCRPIQENYRHNRSMIEGAVSRRRRYRARRWPDASACRSPGVQMIWYALGKRHTFPEAVTRHDETALSESRSLEATMRFVSEVVRNSGQIRAWKRRFPQEMPPPTDNTEKSTPLCRGPVSLRHASRRSQPAPQSTPASSVNPMTSSVAEEFGHKRWGNTCKVPSTVSFAVSGVAA